MSAEHDCGCGSASETVSVFGWMPEGSTITYNADKSITVVPPAGWIYVGFDNTNSYNVVDTGITINCACSSTTGTCSPFAFGDKHGCSTKDCKNCSMNVSGFSDDATIVFTSGGFINLSIPASIMTIGEAYPAVFQAMLFSPDVETKINNFLTSIYGSSPVPSAIFNYNYFTAPDGYKLAFVNICGRAAPLVLPVSALTVSSQGAGGGTCSCQKGSGGCSHGSKLGVEYCSADGCTSCSLTIKDSVEDEAAIVPRSVGGTSFTAMSFQF